MRKVFADTGYWIALTNPNDDLHAKALTVSKQISPFYTVTSEMVMVELFNMFAEKGEYLRKAPVDLIQKLTKNPNCEIVPQTSLQFREAVKRYEDRLDKDWGLTDCASFLIMEEKGIFEALTNDNHFTQAGFRALLRDSA